MIQYALRCDKGHDFDSWFQSASAFDKLAAVGMVTCAACGSSKVEKAVMAPRVRPARSAAEAPAPDPLTAPGSEAERAMAEMKAHIEANTEDVGKNFVREARAMHDGDTPERAIRGEARPEDAKALIEDGVPVVPLPFASNRKTN